MGPTTSKITLRDYLQETEDAISSGRINDALANCQLILSQFPESLEAQRLLGEAHIAQGHLEDAQHAFDWILTNDPENVVTYCDRALTSERMSDYDTALDCYQQAYELSRGNSQIRREFNQLSARAGQAGFMFSRAGLARLYMRGDLLSQAVQEWEAVLATTPDRLDARTGLLETYWREGKYDQVEQLASQLLQEVPGCLKALLLLAYVTARKDIQRARPFVVRAEALDPDLILAQELFADMLASQPADPFLQLLKRPPASLDPTSPPVSLSASQTSLTERPTVEAPALSGQDAYAFLNSTPHVADAPTSAMLPTPSAPPASSSWGSGENWGTDVTMIKPPSNGHAGSENWGTDVTIIRPPSSPSPLSSAQDSDIPIWTSDALAHLNTPEGQHQEFSFGQEASSLQSAGPSSSDPWSGFGQLPGTSAASEPSEASPLAGQENSQLEPWQMLEEARSQNYNSYEAQSWEHQDHLQGLAGEAPADASYSGLSAWESLQESQQGNQDIAAQLSADTSSVWGSPAKEESAGAAAPDWLNMLTQADRRQMSDSLPSLPAVKPVEPPADPEPPAGKSLASEAQAVEQHIPSGPLAPWQQELQAPAAPAGEEEEEELSFGPEWLKSLGATTLNAQEPEQEPEIEERPARQPSKIAEARPEPAYDAWSSVASSVPEAKPIHESWSLPESEAPSRTTPVARNAHDAHMADPVAEQNLLTTLEELEKNLLSNGFVPLEPKSLSTIAQSAQASPAVPPTPVASSQEVVAPVMPERIPDTPEPQTAQTAHTEPIQGGQQDGRLSSVLAELGNVPRPAVPQEEPPAAVEPGVDADWLASFQPVPEQPPTTGAPHVSVQQNDLPWWSGENERKAEEAKGTVARQEPRGVPQQSVPPVAPVRAEPERVFEPQEFSPLTRKTPPTPPALPPLSPVPPTPRMAAPTPSPEAFREDELETTMRRPAVRFQPVQQRPMPRDLNPARGNVREKPVSSSTASNLSYQERLVKGYQRQLAGDYDTAMQEYRIIIRNAPELIGEVVSNVRALLKLAPKYSAGYRVLGDAYMRQGEYLQAMEAYNKALTMAKKARG